MKLLEVHYENITILDDPVMTNDSPVKSNIMVNDQAVSDQTVEVRADNVNTADPQMKSGAYQGLSKESILKDVLFERLSKMEGKFHFDVDGTVQLSVMPSRRVPIAVKDKLKSELRRLEDKGAISKVTEPIDSKKARKPLSSAAKRLQGLLLRMQHYDVEIHYKTGSQMCLADTLPI